MRSPTQRRWTARKTWLGRICWGEYALSLVQHIQEGEGRCDLDRWDQKFQSDAHSDGHDVEIGLCRTSHLQPLGPNVNVNGTISSIGIVMITKHWLQEWFVHQLDRIIVSIMRRLRKTNEQFSDCLWQRSMPLENWLRPREQRNKSDLKVRPQPFETVWSSLKAAVKRERRIPHVRQL